MNQPKPTSIRQKFFIATFILCLVVIEFMAQSFQVMHTKYHDIISELGIADYEAKNYIWENISEERLNIPAFRALTKIATGSRAEKAKEYCNYIKNYITSPEFAQRYEKLRQIAKPKTTPQPVDQENKKAMKTMYEDMLKQFEQMQKEAPAEMKANYQKGIDEYKKILKDLDDPNPELTRWTKEYPESPNTRIRNTLEKFLDITKDVDFKAQLKPGYGGKMYFVNPAYESKPSIWKMCFRGGAEATATVRQFAQDWLKELGAVGSR
jgi:hypothetical protein